jgi:[acyl-carrier-protein] S-malonyltransferase
MTDMNTINVTALCPGQGAQMVGMGRAWSEAGDAAQAIFARADETLGDSLGAPLSELCFNGPADRLNCTDVSQPAIYTCSVACWHGLYGPDAVPAVSAGLSLGEYTALHLTGCFSFEDGLRLVARRGGLMQEAAEASEGGMVAIMGATEDEAEAFCAELSQEGGVLVPANLNAPGQIVLSGDAAMCERAAEACSDRGWRATPLTVAGAFHSAHMRPAADRMAEVLAATPMRPPLGVVWSNVTAMQYEPDDVDAIRSTLVSQITSPVRWAGQLANMVEAGYDQWIELAPGKVLKGLMRRIERSVKVQNHDQPDSTVSA